MKALNPYKITWIALVPKTGKPTKKDNEAISNRMGYHKKFPVFHNVGKALLFSARDKERALEIIEKIKGSLSKEYGVYLFTDKQFGLSSKENKNLDLYKDEVGVKLTKKQIENFTLIK